MTATAPTSHRALRPLLLALLIGASLTACGKGDDDADKDAKDKTEATAEAKDGEKGKDGEKKKEDKPVPVEVAQVAKRPIQASYHGTAALEAPNEAQVVAKTSGVLFALTVEEG